MLGTFITEWEPGRVLLESLLEDKVPQTTLSSSILASTIISCQHISIHNCQVKTDQFVTNCVDIAVHHGFQGWLVNIENVVREDLVPALIEMLAKVDNGTKKVGNTPFIWYRR